MPHATTLRRALLSCLLLAVAVSLTALPAAAGSPEKGAAKGDRYLIMSPHTAEECLKALDDVTAASPALLAKFDWGCKAGDHTGYVVVQAASEDAARAMLPESQREKAKIVKLNKFTVEQIKSFHAKG